VRTTFQNESQGRHVEEIERVTAPDPTVSFEAEFVAQGTGTIVRVGQDGTVLGRSSHAEHGEHGGE
jgi:hypothetical protein